MKRIALLATGAALIAGSLAISREPLFVLAFLFVIVVPFEKWMPLVGFAI